MTGNWTDAEVALVRRLCGKGVSHVEIGRRLGRSRSSVKNLCHKLRIFGRRFWSEGERAYVREHFRKSPARQIAEELNRTTSGVYQCARCLGLMIPQRIRAADFVAYLREKHALGWSDTEIAAARNVDRHAVSHQRRQLGLASNRFNEHFRQKVRENTRRQLERAGLPSIGYLRAKALKDRVRAMGWPANVCIREAEILSLMWDRGPMTRREICEALGMPTFGGMSRRMMHANEPGGSYLATLIRKGFVVSLGRIVRHANCGKVDRAGQGKNVCLYSLSVDIKRKKETTHVTDEWERERQAAGGAVATNAPGGPGADGRGPDGAAALAEAAA